MKGRILGLRKKVEVVDEVVRLFVAADEFEGEGFVDEQMLKDPNQESQKMDGFQKTATSTVAISRNCEKRRYCISNSPTVNAIKTQETNAHCGAFSGCAPRWHRKQIHPKYALH